MAKPHDGRGAAMTGGPAVTPASAVEHLRDAWPGQWRTTREVAEDFAGSWTLGGDLYGKAWRALTSAYALGRVERRYNRDRRLLEWRVTP